MPVASWGLVVPVKRLALAKTRLAVQGPSRADLALAFAADVVSAGLACPSVATVLVVTDDAEARAVLAALGAVVAADWPDAGLNPALAHGAALLRADAPGLGVVTAAADLAALRPDDLAAVLRAVRDGERGFVSDQRGTGTTVLAAAAGAELGPCFGADSRERHRAGGARELTAAASVRLDVDTAEDLRAALELGVGPHTRQALLAPLAAP